MENKYTVDSISQGLARLLSWDEGQDIYAELRELPPGTGEGDILFLELAEGRIRKARLDKGETRSQRQKIEGLLTKLKSKNRPK
jgi:hypothetical protein